MERRECLIFLKGEERTEDILSMDYDAAAKICRIRFRNRPEAVYCYRNQDIALFHPEILSTEHNCIKYKDRLFSGLTGIYRYKEAGYWYLEKDDMQWLLRDENIIVRHSVLEMEDCAGVLGYLRELSLLNPITDEDGNRILAKRYCSIDFVPDDSVFALYLKGRYSASSAGKTDCPVIFPFGCNKSQKTAVLNALSEKLSVVQGPPGTGKTQTILTIIANLLLQGKTAEIVSNNNSAVDNIREKLEKYGLSFLLATLGSAENKKQFIASQSNCYPCMDDWRMTAEEERDCSRRIPEIISELDRYFEIQERLQLKISEQSELETEIRHFHEIHEAQQFHDSGRLNAAGTLLDLIQSYSSYFDRHHRFSLFRRLMATFVHKSLSWHDSGEDGARIIIVLQKKYYDLKSAELSAEISSLQAQLDSCALTEKQHELSQVSMKLLKAALYSKYGKRNSREVFTEKDIWINPGAVIMEYPVVTSTAFSSFSSLRDIMYDYVIIDESSQCDIATGSLSLLSARNAVIVGDVKQLQNIVTKEDMELSDRIFSRYGIAEAYRYSSNSLLSSVCSLFPDIPAVLLREHYRCQPKIIGFCNEKFYDNELVVMTEDKKQKDEIILYLSPPGHHSREHANLRQAEIIAKEILPTLSDCGSIGIITPYHNNVSLIKSVICRDDIQVATIHSFQGREMDTIIFATSDDVVTEFSDSPMLLNVAVSRARNRFILVASAEQQPKNSNMYDLISYILYNSFKSVNSNIISIFDLLYEQSTAARIAFLAKHKKVSEYDSENLMYSMLENIISDSRYREFGFKIICHYPLRYLFRITADMTEEEKLYLSKSWTHVDFLIYRSIGKVPVAGIEVDGFSFHKKGSKQYERDRLKDSIFVRSGLPLLRFSTDGSGEKQAICSFLEEYIAGKHES